MPMAMRWLWAWRATTAVTCARRARSMPAAGGRARAARTSIAVSAMILSGAVSRSLKSSPGALSTRRSRVAEAIPSARSTRPDRSRSSLSAVGSAAAHVDAAGQARAVVRQVAGDVGERVDLLEVEVGARPPVDAHVAAADADEAVVVERGRSRPHGGDQLTEGFEVDDLGLDDRVEDLPIDF